MVKLTAEQFLNLAFVIDACTVTLRGIIDVEGTITLRPDHTLLGQKPEEELCVKFKWRTDIDDPDIVLAVNHSYHLVGVCLETADERELSFDQQDYVLDKLINDCGHQDVWKRIADAMIRSHAPYWRKIDSMLLKVNNQ